MMNPPPPPPPAAKMSTGAKVALVIGALILAAVVVCVGGVVAGGLWIKKQAPGLMEDVREMEREARAFGASHAQAECFPEALRRGAPCGQFDLRCIARTNTFLNVCLRAAPASPGYCDQVPPVDDVMRSVRWRADFCAAQGRANDQRCTNLLSAVQSYCTNPRSYPTAPGGAEVPPLPGAPAVPAAPTK